MLAGEPGAGFVDGHGWRQQTAETGRLDAMETLIGEVAELFPETTYEIAGIDGRNTALEVVFDISMLDTEDRERLLGVLMLTVHDPRVEEVLHDSDSVVVAFLSNPRLQDLRDTFDLSGAYGVLIGDL